MSDEEKKTENLPTKRHRRRRLWVRILKWTGISVGGLVVLFALAASLVVWTLTPQRLTPLVERVASDYLRADVTASRVELTFWHTFPRLTLDVDSLTVVSRTLRGAKLPDGLRLPADADTLLTLRRFHGGLNLAPLAVNHLKLYDVVFDQPMVNMVQVSDSVANYLIVPPDDDTTAIEIPRITIDHFKILNARRLQYRSLADGTELLASLRNLELTGTQAPRYALDLHGSASSPVLRAFNFNTLTFGADGTILWRRERPLAVDFENFAVTVDDYHVDFSTSVDLTDTPVVRSLSAEFVNIPVQEALRHSPAALLPFVAPLRTDMRITTTVELTRPWSFADTLLPSLRGQIDIPPCAVDYEKAHFRRFTGRLSTEFDGSDINGSTFNLEKLEVDGQAVEVSLKARITNVLADPQVAGSFRGDVNLANLPAKLRAMIPVSVTGRVNGEASFRFALSDISKEGFHRVHADGKITLSNISANAQGMGTAFLNRAVLDFGTNRAYQAASGAKIDSLLTVNFTIDSLKADAMGMDLLLADFDARLGSVNRQASIDTAEINPFGGKITIGRLRFVSQADTMRVALRDGLVGGALRRFKGGKRSPLVDLKIGAGRMAFAQALNKVSMRDADMTLNLHLNERAAARRARRDSIAALTALSPALGADSLPSPRPSASPTAAPTPAEEIHLLDKKERRLLRNWDFSGRITASRGRLVTPYFPLRNTLRNINLTFSQDSIALRDLQYEAGQSDFLVNGTISNLRRALSSRRGDNTLRVDLSVTSDTINVNEMVRALFAGTSVAQMADTTAILADDEATEAELQALADTAAAGPLIISPRLDARIAARAENILYGDLQLRHFSGELLCYDGALNLRNLSASTDVGSVDLQALYSAPAADSLSFGLGMQVKNFRLDRLSQLIPAIDSLMPALKGFEGIVDAQMGCTTDLYPNMDINIPSLKAGLRIEGDSLVLLDADTFKSLSKWLMFKNKKRNMIDHMGVEVIVENSAVELFPFFFDIDRYRLGVMGSNDLAMNLDYHVSVLKSPLPFKFGINIKGNLEKPKIRLGGAKLKNGIVSERRAISDTTRINFIRQLEGAFRRGIRKAKSSRINFLPPSEGTATNAAASALGPTSEFEDTTALRLLHEQGLPTK